MLEYTRKRFFCNSNHLCSCPCGSHTHSSLNQPAAWTAWPKLFKLDVASANLGVKENQRLSLWVTVSHHCLRKFNKVCYTTEPWACLIWLWNKFWASGVDIWITALVYLNNEVYPRCLNHGKCIWVTCVVHLTLTQKCDLSWESPNQKSGFCSLLFSNSTLL